MDTEGMSDADAIDLIKEDPESRRIIITLWNPKDKDEDRALLPPCPFLYQFLKSFIKFKFIIFILKMDFNNNYEFTDSNINTSLNNNVNTDLMLKNLQTHIIEMQENENSFR